MGNRQILRSVLGILFLSLMLSPLQTAQATDRVAIQEILAHPDDYEGKEIIRVGNATVVQPRASKRGNEYTLFTLLDGSGDGIKVFARGHPKVEVGQTVTVTGVFQKTRGVGRFTFYNEVEARDIK